MRFQVPQFIEVEDKLIGPLTFKQFVYLAGAGGITLGAFSFFPKIIALMISAPLVILGVALAFYKVNNRPFVIALESFTRYIFKEKLYIWRKDDKKVVKGAASDTENPMVYVPRLSNSKLKDMAWSLDVKKGDTEEPEKEEAK
jgi:PrgI family protein